jgi:phosphoribosylanthranilate isomerase
MNLKVCGITQLKQLQQLDAMDIDFAGLIFYEQSPRFLSNKISSEQIKEADFDLKKVGVFVNQSFDEIMGIVEDYGLDIVQLHGKETPALCKELSDEIEVIKAFQVADEMNIDKLIAPYDAVCDYYLFDTASQKETLGGTGQQFDWSILSKSKIEKPFFLSGGISLQDADNIKKFSHPDLFAIDINSKFETSAGVKDMARVMQMKQALR